MIPGLGKSPGEGNSYPLQYSGLENSMDCIVHGVVGLLRTIQLCFFIIAGQGIDLNYHDIEWFALETEIILSFLRLHPRTAFWSFVDYNGYSISSKEFLPTVVDIMFI